MLNFGLSCDWLFICMVYYCAIASVTKCHGHRSLKQQKFIFLVLGGQNSKVGFIVLKSWCQQGLCLHTVSRLEGRARGKKSAPGGCQHSVAGSCITPSSASLAWPHVLIFCVWISLCLLIRTLVMALGAHQTIQGNPPSQDPEFNHSQRLFFHIR